MKPRNLVSPPSVHWCQDAGQVLVIDENTGRVESLTGLEAAVWKWYSLSYRFAEVLDFTQVSLGRSNEEARLVLEPIIARWVEAGLLAPKEVE
jgi:hypothetical protein